MQLTPGERRPVRRGGRARPAVFALAWRPSRHGRFGFGGRPARRHLLRLHPEGGRAAHAGHPAVTRPRQPRLRHLSGGVGWASGRVVLDMPVAAAYASLLDHRNVKDMTKTTIATTVVDRPDYMAFHLVKIVVTLRALFLKMEVPWTEAWAFSLVEGTAEAPRRIVVSYQKWRARPHQARVRLLRPAGA